MVSDNKTESWDASRERRRFGRFATRLPIATSRDNLVKPGQNRRLSRCCLQVQDFSLGGISAESSVPLKVSENLTMRLPSDGSRPPTELTGRVVHCRRRNNRYQIGIEFCQTRPEASASPWYRLSSLFSLASQFPAERACSSARPNPDAPLRPARAQGVSSIEVSPSRAST